MANTWYNNFGGYLQNELSAGVSSAQIVVDLDRAEIPFVLDSVDSTLSLTLIKIDATGREVDWEIVRGFPTDTSSETPLARWTITIYRPGTASDWVVWPIGTRVENRVTAQNVLEWQEPGPVGPIGESGEDGADGTSVELKGAVDSIADLPDGAEEGDMWITADDGNGYVSDGLGRWTDVGPIRGPTGDTGLTGETGPIGETGPQGLPGDVASSGPIGETGEDASINLDGGIANSNYGGISPLECGNAGSFN